MAILQRLLGLALLGLFINPCPARADFLLFQPAVGYVQGHYDEFAASGIAADFRLGFRLTNAFFIAADVMYGMPSIAAVPPASGSGFAGTLMDMGATLGWDLGRCQVGFTYIFSSKLSWTDSAGLPANNSGGGYKIGVGGYVADKMILGLDAIFDSFTTQVSSGTSTKTPNFLDLAFISLAWKVW